MNRRQFIQSAFYSGLLYGTGMLPKFADESHAAFGAVNNNVLVNLMLDGGPDLRHLIVPAWNPSPSSFGYNYWKARWRAHRLPNDNDATLQLRWATGYVPIQIGGTNWFTNYDSGGLNSGVTFGIWKEAGWLIDMFLQGNVAIFSNAVGGRNRDHNLSTIMMEQGNLSATSNALDYSGWGGRLAYRAGGNPVSLTNTPRAFCFGPKGNNIAAVDNKDLISVQSSRDWGLYNLDPADDRRYNIDRKMAGSLQSYYGTLQQIKAGAGFDTDIWDKFLDHESKIRQFGELIRARLDFPEPLLVRALYDDEDYSGNDHHENDDPNGGASRRVLRSTGFGRQIRNLYDVLASNDLLQMKVASLSYGGWDSHGEQRRRVPSGSDNNSPNISRGIESGLRDIFGGYLETGLSHLTASGKAAQPHCGFSAVWEEVRRTSSPSLDKLVFSVAGEFGRQIRDNGDLGTDHGKGNYMFLIGKGVRGGLYGELFPDTEIAKLNDTSIRTPDIDPKTDLEHVFGAACDWVSPGSSGFVFPSLNSSPGPEAEAGVAFSVAFT